jgi:excisionase family DNA binding protein
MNTGSADNLITPKELARLFKLSSASVYRLVDKRTLPFYKVGGQLRFSLADVEEYLNGVRIEPILK